MTDLAAQTIHIVDDDEAFRDSLVWLLESSGYATRTYTSAEEFLTACQPDMSGCLIVDVRMAGMTGIELHDRLGSIGCTLPTIIVTGHGDVPMAVTAFRQGVVDFIEKPLDEEYVLKQIAHCVAQDRNNREQRQRLESYAQRFESLTPREREVLECIVQGKLNKQIADILNISIKTVEVHRSRVMEKMQVTTIADLVRLKLSDPSQT
jgi:Response regulator